MCLLLPVAVFVHNRTEPEVRCRNDFCWYWSQLYHYQLLFTNLTARGALQYVGNAADALSTGQVCNCATPRGIEDGWRQKRMQRLSLMLRGRKSIHFFVALAILHQEDFINRMNCSRTIWRLGWIHPFLHIIQVQNSLRGKELNQFCPQNSSDDLCLLFSLYPSSMGVGFSQHFEKGKVVQ